MPAIPLTAIGLGRGVDVSMGETGFPTVARRDAPLGPASFSPAYLAEDNRPKIFTIEGIFLALAIAAISLRMYVRVKIIQLVGTDDWTMIAALACSIGVFICEIVEAQHGLGRHLAAVSLSDLKEYWHALYFGSLLWVIGINLVKISIALLLLRLASMSKYRKFLWGIIVILIIYTFVCLGTIAFKCIPVAGFWDPVIRAKARCYSDVVFRNLALFNTFVNVTTDFLLATIPLQLVWKLQINGRTKATLIFILSLGYFVLVAAIIMGYQQAHYLEDKDALFTNDIELWGFIQLQIGIIVACAPTLKPLIRFILERTKAMASRETGSNPKPNGSKSSGRGQSSIPYLKSNSSKPSKSRRTTSIQLVSIQNQGSDSIHAHPADKHGYDVRVEIDGKYGVGNTSANGSSNFDPIETASPKTSQENILPNNANPNQWATNQGGGSYGPAGSQNVNRTGITRTTEVIIKTSTGPTPSFPVGQPERGKF